MRHIHLGPTRTDVAITGVAARHATPKREQSMQVLTWLADEKLLYVASAATWLFARYGGARQRLQADHLLLSVVLANVLPHLVKHVVDQERPDRRLSPPRHGIPKSGKPYDAFPSGHAMHLGAIASAVSWMYPKLTPWAWSGALAIASTRIALLAHWTSDVVVGLAAGAGLERALRPVAVRSLRTRQKTHRVRR
jgi:undecaprenyl-diphosphatase